MVYRNLPWPRSQSRSAEPPLSKLDVHRVGDGPGLARQDQAGPTILGLKYVARTHVDLAGHDAAHT